MNREPITIAAVVTRGVLDEFELMKYSFELFHGGEYTWVARCCRYSAERLSQYPNVHCTVFGEEAARRYDDKEPTFARVVEQKMLAIDDAWKLGGCRGVLYLDCDLLILRPFAGRLLDFDAELILTPHHWHKTRLPDLARFGTFNSGFLFTTNPEFHGWWRHAFLSQPHLYTDQQCLDSAPERFRTVQLGEEANVGLWRCENGTHALTAYKVPENCWFMHVHFFQPGGGPERMINSLFNLRLKEFTSGRQQSPEVFTHYQMLHKTFALACLIYLMKSSDERHRHLYNLILDRDSLRIYSNAFESAARLMAVEA